MRLPDTKDLHKVGPFKLDIERKNGYFYITTAKGVICCDGLLVGPEKAIEPLLNYRDTCPTYS